MDQYAIAGGHEHVAMDVERSQKSDGQVEGERGDARQLAQGEWAVSRWLRKDRLRFGCARFAETLCHFHSMNKRNIVVFSSGQVVALDRT